MVGRCRSRATPSMQGFRKSRTPADSGSPWPPNGIRASRKAGADEVQAGDRRAGGHGHGRGDPHRHHRHHHRSGARGCGRSRDLADRHLGHPAAHRRRGPQVGRAAADRNRGVPEGDGADRRLPGARRAVHRHVRRLGGLRPGRQGHPERGPLAADHGQHRCQQDAGDQLRRLPHIDRPVPARHVPQRL